MGVVLDAAEAVSQAADLGDDQVNEGVDQLVEDLQVLVLLEAAETLPGDTEGKTSMKNFIKKLVRSQRPNRIESVS